MSDPAPNIIAYWVRDDISNIDYQPVVDVLFYVLRKRLAEKSEEEIAELSESSLFHVINFIEDYSAENIDDGIEPTLEIFSDGDEAYIRKVDTTGQKLLIELKKIHPDDFEIFCSKILQNLGAESARVGGSEDGGVDFIAYNLNLGSKPGPSPKVSKAMLIGQAKRYTDHILVKETEVRKFIGGGIRIAHETRNALVGNAGILTPIVYAFWTTSDFNSSAKKYSKNMGIWYLNGIGLAQLAIRAGVSIEDVTV